MDLMSQEEKVARARMKQDAFNAFDAEVRFSMMRPIPLEVAIKRMEMKQDAFDAWAAVASSMNPDPKKNNEKSQKQNAKRPAHDAEDAPAVKRRKGYPASSAFESFESTGTHGRLF